MLMQLKYIVFYIDCETEQGLVSLLYIKKEKMLNKGESMFTLFSKIDILK